LDESANSVACDSLQSPVILLGLGFTTSRLARRLLLRRVPVVAVVRKPERYSALASAGLRMVEYSASTAEYVPVDSVLIHTVPPLTGEENEKLRSLIYSLHPARVIYISSTGVYGQQTCVDSASLPAPSEEKGQRRVDEENWLNAGPWSTTVIRPAAIYGPGRGIQARLKDGRVPRAEGTKLVSRIHVDDLAAILEAAALQPVQGCWPVADSLPCSTDAIREWCGQLMNIDVPRAGADSIPVAGRTVDADGIREKLGVVQRYAAYPAGLLASVAEEIVTGGAGND
jgi:nucleoside-diphosphate-sugar epimerase